MTTADNSAWLRNEAVYLRSIDTALQTKSTLSYGGAPGLLPGGGQGLLDAAAGLTAWSTIGPTGSTQSWLDSDLAYLPGGDTTAVTLVAHVAVGDRIRAMRQSHDALYSGAAVSSTNGRLHDDAQHFEDIATRVDANAVTAADVAWLTAETAYFLAADAVISNPNPAFGLQSAADAVDKTGIQTAAATAGDFAGFQLVRDSVALMRGGYTAIYPRATSGFGIDALHMTAIIVPQLAQMAGVKSPSGAGSSSSPTPTKTASSSVGLVVGSVSVVGIGLLAHHLWKKRHRR